MSDTTSEAERARAREALEPLHISKVTLVTSYRRDGQGVGTPVGITLKDDKAFFTTRSKTWKVKRIANNPNITVAPCTKTGKVLGPTVQAIARRIDPSADDTGDRSFEGKFWIFVYRLIYRDVPVTYEVIPVLDDAPTS